MDDPSAFAQAAIPRMKRPTLAMLPFHVASEADEEWLGRGLAGDVLDESVRRGRFSAVSRHTTFRLAREGKSLDAQIKADCFVGGNLSRANGRYRLVLAVQNEGTETNIEVSANELQALVDSAVEVLEAHLCAAKDLPSGLRQPERPLIAPLTYRRMLQSFDHLWSFDRTGNAAALRIARDIAINDPEHLPAQALKAFLVTRAYRSGWVQDRPAVAQEARMAVDLALNERPNDPTVLWSAAFVEAMLFRRYPIASDLVRQACWLHPHSSHALTWGSLFLSYDLDFDGALAKARRAMAVSPYDPLRKTQAFAGALAAIHGARDKEALEMCELVLSMDPQMVNVLRIKAVALHYLGMCEQAREVIRQLLAIDPQESVALASHVNPLREWPGFARFAAGLSASGLP